jgi:hypothetical protein
VIFAGDPCHGGMFKSKITGAAAALALLVAPSVAVAHDGHHHKGHHHKHHAKKAKIRDIAAGAPTATVASFANGELTLTTTSGKTFTATVSDKTKIKCFTVTPAPAPAPAPAATTARHGNDGDDDDGPNHDAGDDHGDDNGNGTKPCGTDALVAGAKIAAAKLSLLGEDATWKKVVVLK